MLVSNLLKQCLKTNHRNNLRLTRHFANNNVADGKQDEESDGRRSTLFFNPRVQQLLKDLTTVDLEKVFQAKKYQEKLRTPKYKFMTTEELEEALQETAQKAEEQLQMPPVLPRREEKTEILARDSLLKDWDPEKSTYIFTDITFGLSDQERLIVKRDPEGTLSKATWEERDRINQLYFPFPGRKWIMPKMFEPEYLEDLLKREEYMFILDRACVQFEPNHPDYIDCTQKTYEYINEKKAFDKLRSTRHFGPMAFHLASTKQIDNLVLECLQKERIDDAARAVQLLHLIHPDCASVDVPLSEQNKLEFLKNYAKKDSKKHGAIELAIQAYEELNRQKEEVKRNVEEAHGS
ncbi:small ribosomal subunit protein mS22 [Neocloeon triangulifer]|uniref:small ribosomal subunit protein mS22 n=1 Tax=Neocloeon triangulifer TaxID=2078957 RepID=UPI00286FAE77|nr:small ribosomal subunit protein mS22 [Neocloeon triangulifer]